MAIIFKLTDAGRQALINAKQDGSIARTIVSVGITATAFTPLDTQTTIPGEIKRLASIAGDVVAKDTIHITIRDDGGDTYTVRGLGVYLDNGVLLGTYSQAAVILEKSGSSILLLSTDMRVLDGGEDISTLQFGATNFINPPATTERQGVVELATKEETASGADGTRAVTPEALKPLLDGKQPLDATLTALAGIATAADRLIYAIGQDKFQVTPLTAFIRTLLDDADAAAARLTLGAAPLESPSFTGIPAAPTAAVGTSTTQLATTAFVIGQAATAAPKMDAAAAAVGTATRFAREDHAHPTDSSRAPLESPSFTGMPAAPTAAEGTSTTQLATTAFVQGAVGGYLAKAVTGGIIALTEAEASNPVIALTGTLTANLSLVVPTTVKRLWAIFNSTNGNFTVTIKTAAGSGVTVAQGKRNLVYTDGANVYDGFNDFENIALTGISTAPTAAAGTSTTQLATTAFVVGQAATAVPKMDAAVAAVGTATRFAREDHAHSTDTSRAPLESPALTGAPTAPTAAVNANNSQLANTAFVIRQAATAVPKMDAASAAVGTATRFAREDHAHPIDTSRAPLVSPTFTGNPAAPTPAKFDADTSIATTAFVRSAGVGYSTLQVMAAGSFTITPSQVGSLLYCTGTADYTGKLPLLSSVPDGSVVRIKQASLARRCTVTRQGTDLILGNHSGGSSFFIEGIGDVELVAKTGVGWIITGGSVFNEFTGQFSNSIAGNGFQRLPSGLIIQWGTITGFTGSPYPAASAVLPIAFTTAVYSVSATSKGAAVSCAASATLNIISVTNSTSATSPASWIAIGK